MFENAKSFNIDLSKWDVNLVKRMTNMFKGASAFTHIWCSDDWREKISYVDFLETYDEGEEDENGGRPVLNLRGSGKVMCCITGQYYDADQTCKACSPGEYNGPTHVKDKLPTSCETCPRNTFAPIKGLPGCSNCSSNQYR